MTEPIISTHIHNNKGTDKNVNIHFFKEQQPAKGWGSLIPEKQWDLCRQHKRC